MRDKLFVTLLGGTALAWNTQSACGSSQCVENPLNLSPNTQYRLKYETSTHTSGSHQNDGIVTESRSLVTLETGATPCEMQLTVDKSQNEDVNTLPLRFVLDDGRVSAMCPHSDDNVDSLNFKRALLSMIQTHGAEQDVLEQDIYGKCITHFEESGGERRKVKNLAQCAQTQRDTMLWTFGRMATLDEALEGELTCLMKNGLDSVKCTEERTLKQPFGDDKTPLFSSYISTRLTLDKTESGKGLVDYSFDQMGTIGFELNRSDDEVDNNQAAVDTLNQMCQAEASIDSYQHVPLYMRQLMEHASELTSQELINLWHVSHSSCPRGRDSVEQILGWCSSENCLRAGSIIAAKGNNVDEWIESVGYNAPPSPTVVELLHEHAEKSNQLANLGAAINKACNAGFCNHRAVRNAISWVDDKAALSCENGALSNEERRDLLAGVENARHITPETFSVCTNSHYMRASHLVQVLQSTNGAECATMSPLLFDLVTGVERASVEVRAHAYLSLWKCPTIDDMSRLTQWYAEEPSLQMQHFMYSHAMSLRFSSDPLKHFVKPYASHIVLEEPVDYLNHQQYSKYWDVTMPMGHHALTADGYVIYERESPLPRSIHANVTLALYNEPISLLDVRLRQENLQKLLFPQSEQDNNDALDSVAAGNYASDYKKSNVDIDVTMMGRSMLSTTLDEADLRQIQDKNFMWQRFTDKISQFEFVEAFKMMMGKTQIDVNKNVILGLFTMKLPNLIGSKTELKFDLIGSTSIYVEARGLAMKSFTGTFTPKATVELAASYMIGDHQGIEARVNAATATTNAIELSMADGNYGVRFDTPDAQNIIAVTQEVTLVSPDGRSQVQPWEPPSPLVEYNQLGHRVYMEESRMSNCRFLVTPYHLSVGIERTDPSMTHFAAQIVHTGTLWSATLGFPKSTENFVLKVWHDADNNVYSTGGQFNGFGANVALETELDLNNNEAKVQYTHVDQRVYMMHGRAENNADGSVHTMVAIQTPSKKFELISRYINESTQKSIAFSVTGFPKKVHADITLQDADPMFAVNLQFGQMKFSTDVQYTHIPLVGGGANHTVSYIISIPKHNAYGTTELIMRNSEWAFQSKLSSDLFKSKPILVSAMYRLTQENGRTDMKLIVPAIRLPSILDVINTKLVAQFDANENKYGLLANTAYTFYWKQSNPKEEIISITAKFQGDDKNKGARFDYAFISTQFEKYGHKLEYNLAPTISNDIVKQLITSFKLRWSNFDDDDKMISFHQLFKQQPGDVQQSYFLGMNATAFGDGVKLYSDIRKKGSRFTTDLRAKYGTLDELERIKPAAFIVKLDNQLSTRQKMEVRGDLKLPGYVARHWTFNHEDVEGGFKLNVKQVRSNVVDYVLAISVPITVDAADGPKPLKSSVKGRFINTQYQFESTTAVIYMDSELFRLSTTSKMAKSDKMSKRMIMSQLKYPQLSTDGSFEMVESVCKIKLVDSFTAELMEYDFLGSLTTNHQLVVEHGLSSLFLSSALRLEPESNNLAFNLAGKTSRAKKAEIDIAYDNDDQSVSVDLRQTFTPKMPSVLSGSGRFDKKDSKVTVNFNRDKNPITVFVHFPSVDGKIIYKLLMTNNDRSLIELDVPTLVSAAFVHEGLSTVTSKFHFNSTWSTNRGVSVLVSNHVEGEDYEQFFEMENNAFSNAPKHVTFESKINIKQADWTTALAVDEIYTLDTTANLIVQNDGLVVEAGFVNNLIAGPYSALGKVDLTEEAGTLMAQWEGDYKGTSPCSAKLSYSREDMTLKYLCDEVENDYDISFKINKNELTVSVNNADHTKEELDIKLFFELGEKRLDASAQVIVAFDDNDDVRPISFVGDINPISWSMDSAVSYTNNKLSLVFNDLKIKIELDDETHELAASLKLPKEVASEEYGNDFNLLVSDISTSSFKLRVKCNTQSEDILVLAYRLNNKRDDFGFELKFPLEKQRISLAFDRHSEERVERDEITVNLIDNNGESRLISYRLNCEWNDYNVDDCSFAYDLDLLGVSSSLDIGAKSGAVASERTANEDQFIRFSLGETSVEVLNTIQVTQHGPDQYSGFDQLEINLNGDEKMIKLGGHVNENESMQVYLRNNFVEPIKLDNGFLNVDDFALEIKFSEKRITPKYDEPSFSSYSSYQSAFPAQETKEYKEISISQNLFSLNGDGDIELKLGAGEGIDKEGNDAETFMWFKFGDSISYQEASFTALSKEHLTFTLSGIVDLLATYNQEAISHGAVLTFEVSQQATNTTGPLSELIKQSTEGCLADEDCRVHLLFSARDHTPYRVQLDIDTNAGVDVAYYVEAVGNDDKNKDEMYVTLEINDQANSFEDGSSLFRYHIKSVEANENETDTVGFTGELDGSMIVKHRPVKFSWLGSDNKDENSAKMEVTLDDSYLEIEFNDEGGLPFDMRFKTRLAAPAFIGIEQKIIVDSLKTRLRVQSNGMKMLLSFEEYSFNTELMFSAVRNAPKFNAKFNTQVGDVGNSMLSDAMYSYRDFLAKPLFDVEFNFEAEHIEDESVSMDLNLTFNEKELALGFKFSAIQSRIYLKHPTALDIPHNMAIGYKYTAATIQEPMGLDVELEVGENVETIISTKFGAELRTEGTPSAKVFFQLTNHGIDALDFLPLQMELDNVISLKNAEISTVWWRNLQNFELVNTFTMDQTWSDHEHNINWAPHVKVVTRNDGLEYEIGITHNCDIFAKTGIPTGDSFVRYQVDVNSDVMELINQLTSDSSTKFESMIARMAMLVGSPVFVPSVPLQRLQHMILAPKSRSKRQATSATYETEASFIISRADQMQTLRLVESFEQRRTSFKTNIELQNDFAALAAVTGEQFKLDGEIDTKRREARVSVLLYGERYLVDSKYDAEFVSENGRVSMELNEVRLEQNIPFFTDVGLPNKLETTANCFVEHKNDDFLATCDNIRVVIGSLDSGDKEYSASGSYKVAGADVNANIYFDHNDEALSALGVAKKNHVSSTGTNNVDACPKEHKCYINSRTNLIVEQSNDQFESLQLVHKLAESLKVYKDLSSSDTAYGVDYASKSAETEATINALFTDTKKSNSIYVTANMKDQTADISVNVSKQQLNGDISIDLSDSSDKQGSIGASYSLDYGHGSASAHAINMDKINNFETGVQYTMAGDYGVGFYYHEDPAELNVGDYLADGFVDHVTTMDNAYKVFVLNANQQAFTIEHATSNSDLNKASIEWSTLPLQIDGNIVQNGANYTVHVNPKQILMTHSDSSNKVQQVEFGYKFVDNERPTMIVELFHTCEYIPVEPFMVSIGSGLTDFVIAFQNEINSYKFEVALVKPNQLSIALNSNDEKLEVSLALLTNKLGIRSDYTNALFGVDHDATAQLYISPAIVFEATFNGDSGHFKLVPVLEVDNGFGRFGLRSEQNMVERLPQTAEAVLATQLGLVSAQAGFEAMINEKEYGKSNIKVEWESGLSLIITDNIFNGKPFELNLNMGVNGAGAELQFVSSLKVPTQDVDTEVYLSVITPVFDASTKTGVIVGMNSHGFETKYGVLVGLNLPQTFVVQYVAGDEPVDVFSWEVTELYQKLNLGIATIEQSNQVLTVTMDDGTWVELDGQLKQNGLHMEVRTSPDYNGAIAPLVVDIGAQADSGKVQLDVRVNDDKVEFAVTHDDDSVGISFVQTDSNSQNQRENYFTFVNEDNKIGFEGEINGDSADFSIAWDYEFNESGFLTIIMHNGVTDQLPEQASLTSKWNLKSVIDNLQITCEFDTPNLHRSLMIKGGVQSPTNFVISVDHDLEILPIPSFQISFATEDEKALTLAAGNEKLEVFFTPGEKKISLEMPSLKLPIKKLSAYYGEEPAQFDIKINDMELGFVVNEIESHAGSTKLDFDAVSRIPALTPQRIRITTKFSMSRGRIDGHFERHFDESNHITTFAYQHEQSQMALSLNHNDTILYALYVPEQLEIIGNIGQHLGKSEMLVLSIEKFQINSVELKGKARFSLVPFAFDFKSDQLAIESEFSPEHWFLRVQSDGSVPGLNYKKLAIARTSNEYVFRVTDAEDNTRSMKLYLAANELTFSNKVVALLPEELSLKYKITDNDFYVDFVFTTFTLDFTGNLHATYGDGGISLALTEQHTFQGAEKESNALKIVLNHKAGSKYEPLTVLIAKNDEMMGVETMMMSKPGALLFGYRLKNIEFLGIAKQFQADYSTVTNDKEQSLTLRVRVDKDNTKIKAFINRDHDETSQSTRAGLFFQHNDEVFDVIKADFNIAHDDKCTLSFNSFVGSINVVSDSSETVVTLANDQEQLVYTIVHVITLPSVKINILVNEALLFAIETSSADLSASLIVYIMDKSHIVQCERSEYWTKMAIRHCQRAGFESACGDEQNEDYMAAVSIDGNKNLAIYDYRGYTKHNGKEHDVFRFNLFNLVTGDHQIHLWLGSSQFFDFHAKWDMTTFVEGALWSESEDWMSFGIATADCECQLDWVLIDSFKLSHTRNGQNVFAYQVVYNVDFDDSKRSRRNKNHITVTTTHHLALGTGETKDFGVDVEIDHTSAERNGITTINANISHDDEVHNVLVDIAQDQGSDIYSVNAVTKNFADTRTFVELNHASSQLTAYFATPEAPDKARLTAQFDDKLSVFAKFDESTATLEADNATVLVGVGSFPYEANANYNYELMTFDAWVTNHDEAFPIWPFNSMDDDTLDADIFNRFAVCHMDSKKVIFGLNLTDFFTKDLRRIVTQREFEVFNLIVHERDNIYAYQLKFDIRNVC